MALMKFITENTSNSPYDEKYQDDDALWDVIGYVCNPEKTGGCVGGWAVDPNHAAYEMELLAKLFHNDRGWEEVLRKQGGYPAPTRGASALQDIQNPHMAAILFARSKRIRRML